MNKHKKKEPRFPKSRPTDDTDHIAIRRFDSLLSPKWIKQEPSEDKGCDRIIEIKENDELRGKKFAVQIKGTTRPHYDDSHEYLKIKLRVSTIHYLVAYSPGMLCVCSVNEEGQPIYWVWLQEAIKDLEVSNPNWEENLYATIRIPVGQKFDINSHQSIEKYVSDYFDNISMGAAIGSFIAKPLGLAETPYQPTSLKLEKILTKKVGPFLQKLGVADVASRGGRGCFCPLSKSDQLLFSNIIESSNCLDSLEDRKAQEILDRAKKKIRYASKQIKARYFNNLGVLALHKNETKKGLAFFVKAHKLEPCEKKYITNQLAAEYYLALISGPLSNSFLKDWVKRLERTRKRFRNYQQVLFLKAEYLSKLGLHESALDLIQSSSSWKRKDFVAYVNMAGALFDNNSFQEIVDLFKSAENRFAAEPFYWSIYGDAHLAIALKKETQGIELMGPGPAEIDLDSLKQALDCYIHAWELFRKKGFPKPFEQAVLNYSASLILLGEFTKCEEICSIYLDFNPDSVDIICNNVAALNFQNNKVLSHKAVSLAKRAYSICVNSQRAYENLIISLFVCDMHDQVVRYALEREKKGFNNTREEAFSRLFLSISFDTLGKDKLCEEQLKKLKNIPGSYADYCLARAEVEKRQGKSSDEILGLLRSSQDNLKDERILAKIVGTLLPIDRSSAEPIAEIIQSLAEIRQLSPEEFAILGRSYLELGDSGRAYRVFRRGSVRYPHDERFLFLCAMAAYEDGNEADAYACLEQYLEKGEKDFALLKNVALLAGRIGKAEESIAFLERALRKADDPSQKAELHCLLYEAKRTLSKPAPELLRHAHEYGSLITKENKVDEVRYLMMFMFASGELIPYEDPELASWITIFRNRLNDFLAKNPDYPALRVLRIPLDMPDNKKSEYLVNQIAYLTLPRRLALASFELAMRSQPWPLSFRAEIMFGAKSIFDYWSRCTKSNEYAHGIHIWSAENQLKEEVTNSYTKDICIDISALLTLARYDLLQALTLSFRRIVVAEGTMQSIEYDRVSPIGQSDIAKKIYEWKQGNLRRIRVMKCKTDKPDQPGVNELLIDSLSSKRDLSIIIGDGEGESLLLAKQLGLVIYSDDTSLRILAQREYKVRSFCTISLLARLREEGKVQLAQETLIYSKMIGDNFRIIPFGSHHLFSALGLMLKERRADPSSIPTSRELIESDILGPFLEQFPDPMLNYEVLENIAAGWWVTILGKYKEQCPGLLVECMEYASWCLSTQRTTSGVIQGIKSNETVLRASRLWARFLVKCTIEDSSLNLNAWIAVRSSSEKLFNGSEAQQKIVLFEKIPDYLIRLIWKSTEICPKDRENFLYRVTENFGYEMDKGILDAQLAKCLIKRKR